jgi:hypothetical protein
MRAKRAAYSFNRLLLVIRAPLSLDLLGYLLGRLNGR